MDAWSEIPVPSEFLQNRTALERQGALVFKLKQCHNCHSLDNQGGKRGPALDAVAVRLTPDQLIRQVIQGGGNMPAYGKNLKPGRNYGARRLPRDSASCRTITRARCVAYPGARSSKTEQLQQASPKIEMTPDAESVLQSWSAPLGLYAVLLLTAFVYVRGWLHLRKGFPSAIPAWRFAAFLPGWNWLRVRWPSARRSPRLTKSSLTVHMIQHLLLMSFAPPLVLLGAPALPLLHGLPQFLARDVVGPILRWRPMQWLGGFLTNPAVAWSARRAHAARLARSGEFRTDAAASDSLHKFRARHFSVCRTDFLVARDPALAQRRRVGRAGRSRCICSRRPCRAMCFPVFWCSAIASSIPPISPRRSSSIFPHCRISNARRP